MADDPLNAQPDEELREVDDNNNRWLGEIGADIRSLASSIRHTASGVASFVHRSALTVAEEIARLEEEEEEEQELRNQRIGKDSDEQQQQRKEEPIIVLRLPWELLQPQDDNESCMQSTFFEDPELKRRVLLLSHDEASFLQPHRQVLDEDEALDKSRIDLIQRILKVDDHLAIAHKNLQNTVSEATFWCNYFESCSAVRQKYLQEQLEAVDDEDEQNEEDSFVCVDNSVKSHRSAGMRSVDSLVLVESRFTNSMNV